MQMKRPCGMGCKFCGSAPDERKMQIPRTIAVHKQMRLREARMQQQVIFL